MTFLMANPGVTGQPTPIRVWEFFRLSFLCNASNASNTSFRPANVEIKLSDAITLSAIHMVNLL